MHCCPETKSKVRPKKKYAQTGGSLKRTNRLSSDFFLLSVTVSQASTITAKAITTVRTRIYIITHWVLYSLPIGLKDGLAVSRTAGAYMLDSCPARARLPARNGLVNEVEFLGLITQNG